MSIKGLARGSFGDLVGTLQTALQQSGLYTGTIDGDFGGGTERAVRSLQADAGTPQTGCADPATWQRATGLEWPDLFERCLQLTARLEGHGYQMVAGNFDGAGLTWGIIGFTLKHGEVQALVREAMLRDPALVPGAFGPAADELLRWMACDDWGKLKAWTDSISTGRQKSMVEQPWRDGFRRLGQAPLMKQLQRDRARRIYFVPAMTTALDLELGGDLGAALAFDIQVQNGGVKSSDRKAFERRAQTEAPTPRARRILLADLVAASAKAAWRADVKARKSAIATGTGEVHGARLDLSAWGLDVDD
jgi:peptidoglycan hydrolase-like protein with peptidoglycan-binding domain